MALPIRISSTLFQSTPPRGGRLAGLGQKDQITMFQSTPPRGGRLHDNQEPVSIQVVSIHAPAWGATWGRPSVRQRVRSFNPRPRVGGDTRDNPKRPKTLSFNPRPRVGGDE